MQGWGTTLFPTLSPGWCPLRLPLSFRLHTLLSGLIHTHSFNHLLGSGYGLLSTPEPIHQDDPHPKAVLDHVTYLPKIFPGLPQVFEKGTQDPLSLTPIQSLPASLHLCLYVRVPLSGDNAIFPLPT